MMPYASALPNTPNTTSAPNALVTCDNLVKIYKVDDIEVVALQGLDLSVAAGEMVAIVGASGSGKSTLLNVVGGLDVPSAGRCFVGGNDLTRMSEAQRTTYRCFSVGHIWQQSGRNLLPELTLAENVALPQVMGGAGVGRRAKRTAELLELVGMAHHARKKPHQLSGGEQQRGAIAVALANAPALLLADEPTGELDSVTAGEMFALLRRLNKELKLTTVIVTHDAAIASQADRTLAIRDGRTSTETVRREAPLAAGAHNGGASAVIGLPGETHREVVLIDRVGRLQLPAEAIERIAFGGRADVRILADHVELWPAHVSATAAEGNGNGAGGAQLVQPAQLQVPSVEAQKEAEG
jgi:putative ABC transport system ATP-binding protein